ncbi:MAG TPA: apolipoprotein N-acyltransferase [Candidatus Polarisedimenticolia bacterium]|nr:apolipoprotein N-acyltransferase [Candidatus Polarisedimenticolia bacterium]
MNYAWHTRVLLALASGLALALSFPNYNLSLLAWVAAGLLLLASYRSRPAVAPLYGFLHALVCYPVSLPWIDVVMRQYGNVPAWTSAGILGLVAVVEGIICAFFSWGIAVASRKSPRLTCALAPALWVTLEFARANLPIFAFPWNLIGYAASGNLALVQLAAVTGIYGLSFVVAGYGSLVAYAALVGTQRAWKTALVTTAALILIAVGGRYFVPSAAPRFVAHLVQTNFPQSETYPPNWMQLHARELDQLARISVDAATKSPKSSDHPDQPDLPSLIVWPEVPAPFTFQDADFAARAAEIARDSHSDFLVGVVDWKRDEAGHWLATNSAVLLDRSGRRVFTYDKIHLVPFGEYVPLRRWLTFAGKLTADIGDFTAGTVHEVGNLQVAQAYFPSPGPKFGAFICYEAVFPGSVRKFTAGGAQLLINISNDGWFGRSAAPAQHLMMARVRAVENRRWLLRDTNNGFTVAVDPYGRIAAELATDIRGELDAPYDFRSELTPYVRFGDWFAWLCVIESFVLLGASIKIRKDKDLSPKQNSENSTGY